MNWNTLLAVDFDKWAAATYRANFPDTRVECGPVSDLIDRLPEVDVVLGGPPCQPHSHAGKRQASKDSRDCGPDFVAAIGKVRPRAFLMENVPGLLSSENGRYFQRMYAAMEGQGYVIQYRVQDAVSFGVPQFRKRLWVWGIRRDLYVDGIRHVWPKHTHCWPPPLEDPDMFGLSAALHYRPGITVGEALGIECSIRRIRGSGVERRDHPSDEPCPTVMAPTGGKSGLMMVGIPRNINERAGNKWRPVGEPSPTIDGIGPSIRIIGGGMNPHFAGEHRTERDITDEPSTTIPAHHTHNAVPAVHEYRWSDAMLQKHTPASPASPASPAPTILGKYYKGGAEGLLEIDTKQQRTCRPIDDPAPTVAHDSRHFLKNNGMYVRRLTPIECMRLQSAPDDFRWPEKITKTAMYKICGNGWASAHGAAFSAALAKADPDSSTVIDLFCGGGLGACGWHGRYWSYEPKLTGVA